MLGVAVDRSLACRGRSVTARSCYRIELDDGSRVQGERIGVEEDVRRARTETLGMVAVPLHHVVHTERLSGPVAGASGPTTAPDARSLRLAAHGQRLDSLHRCHDGPATATPWPLLHGAFEKLRTTTGTPGWSSGPCRPGLSPVGSSARCAGCVGGEGGMAAHSVGVGFKPRPLRVRVCSFRPLGRSRSPRCRERTRPAFAGWLGGEGGIRTPGTPKGTPVFETGPIDHSGTSPNGAAKIAVRGTGRSHRWDHTFDHDRGPTFLEGWLPS